MRLSRFHPLAYASAPASRHSRLGMVALVFAIISGPVGLGGAFVMLLRPFLMTARAGYLSLCLAIIPGLALLISLGVILHLLHRPHVRGLTSAIVAGIISLLMIGVSASLPAIYRYGMDGPSNPFTPAQQAVRATMLFQNCWRIKIQPADVLQSGHESGRDSSDWYLIRMDSARIDELKARVISAAKVTPGVTIIDDSDRLDSYPFVGQKVPAWWKPQSLPDLDVLATTGHWFAFSRLTGQVYLFEWDM